MVYNNVFRCDYGPGPLQRAFTITRGSYRAVAMAIIEQGRVNQLIRTGDGKTDLLDFTLTREVETTLPEYESDTEEVDG